jgi:deoxyribodipyrimidine photo-lyase
MICDSTITNLCIVQAIAHWQLRQIIPVYCFDPRQFGTTSYGFPKTGAFRAQFLRESVADLRRSLRSLGCDLIIRTGLPEVILPALAQEIGATGIYFSKEVTAEEVAVETALQSAVKPLGNCAQVLLGAYPLPSRRPAVCNPSAS